MLIFDPPVAVSKSYRVAGCHYGLPAPNVLKVSGDGGEAAGDP
jgi:hypothetical protein